MSNEKNMSEEQRREEILKNLSPEGIKEALEKELKATNDSLEFLNKKVEQIHLSLAKYN